MPKAFTQLGGYCQASSCSRSRQSKTANSAFRHHSGSFRKYEQHRAPNASALAQLQSLKPFCKCSVPCAVLQIAQQSRVIVAQEQTYARDIAKLNVQLMHYSAVGGIKSFSPSDLAGDSDDEE